MMRSPSGRGRLRVLQLGSPTGLYGAERWILALIRHLDPLLVDAGVAVVRDDPAQGEEPELCERARELGFDSRVIDAPGRVNWSAVRQLRALLLEQGTQILHTHGYKTDLIGLFATRGLDCRLVTTPHGWSAAAGMRLACYEALDRAILPCFDAVLPLSDELFRNLRWIPGLRRTLQLIPNGVDIDEIDAAPQIAPQLAEWRQQGMLVVGYIGQLIERKGLATLLRAFARLERSPRRLVLVGDGPQREQLGRLAGELGIADQVLFTGFRADRLALLRGFDVFVLPSRLEGIPRCLMEAQAAGVAVVASDICGTRDLVAHDDSGLLFPVDDCAALETCLAACCDATTRTRFALRARQRVVAEHSATAMAAAYQQLYRRLTDAPVPARVRHA